MSRVGVSVADTVGVTSVAGAVAEITGVALTASMVVCSWLIAVFSATATGPAGAASGPQPASKPTAHTARQRSRLIVMLSSRVPVK